MPDIETRVDIEQLMNAFYAKAIHDKQIGHYFTEVIQLDLQAHLPVICDFWESVLFDTGGYKGNVMQVHKHIHQLSAFKKEHFDQWLSIFKHTVDELFNGDNAEKIKQRATSIATVMTIKLLHETNLKI